MDERFDVVVNNKILHKYDEYDQAVYVAMTYICAHVYDNITKEIIFQTSLPAPGK